MFELHQIEQFLAVVDCGTVSKAAEKLNITQPALSRSLQNLEYELKTPLFTRTKNKVILTETGNFAASYARKLLSFSEEMQKEIQNFYRTHTKILIASCAPCDLLYEIQKIVKENFAGEACELLVENDEEILKKVLDGSSAMALFSKPPADKALLDFPLKTEHLFALIPENHPLASRKKVSFSEINGEAVVPFPLKGYWTSLLEKKLPDSQLLYQANIQAFDKVINSSNLICFASDMLPNELLHHKLVPLVDAEATITYHLGILKTNRELFKSVTNQIVEFAKSKTGREKSRAARNEICEL